MRTIRLLRGKCPYCGEGTALLPDQKTGIVYDQCDECGKIISGEVTANGRLKLDGPKGEVEQPPGPIELDCGCILSVTKDGTMNIQYCRPDCEAIEMVADEIKRQTGGVQKIFPAEN